MDPGLAVDRYGTSAIVRNDREARACRREYQAPLCPSQVLLAPVRAQERRYQLPPRRVTHPCGKLTLLGWCVCLAERLSMEFRIWVEVRLAGRVLDRKVVAQVERAATGIVPEEIGLTLRKVKRCSARCRLA